MPHQVGERPEKCRIKWESVLTRREGWTAKAGRPWMFQELPALPHCCYSVVPGRRRVYFFSQPMVVQSGTWERLWNREGP